MLESREQFKVEKELREKNRKLKKELNELRKRTQSKTKTGQSKSYNDTSIDSELRNKSFQSKRQINELGSIKTLCLTLDIKKNHLKRELKTADDHKMEDAIEDDRYNRFSNLSSDDRR